MTYQGNVMTSANIFQLLPAHDPELLVERLLNEVMFPLDLHAASLIWRSEDRNHLSAMPTIDAKIRVEREHATTDVQF